MFPDSKDIDKEINLENVEHSVSRSHPVLSFSSALGMIYLLALFRSIVVYGLFVRFSHGLRNEMKSAREMSLSRSLRKPCSR